LREAKNERVALRRAVEEVRFFSFLPLTYEKRY
jgi:hypothetical protein